MGRAQLAKKDRAEIDRICALSAEKQTIKAAADKTAAAAFSLSKERFDSPKQHFQAETYATLLKYVKVFCIK